MPVSREMLVSELRDLLRLTAFEQVVATVRRAQAADGDVARELAANAAKSAERLSLLHQSVRSLTGVPDLVGPVLGRAGALVQTTADQAQTLQSALLGDLALEHQLRERARYARTLAVSLGEVSVLPVLDRLDGAHTATIQWLEQRLAEVGRTGTSALRPTPVQALVGTVRRVYALPLHLAADGVNRVGGALGRLAGRGAESTRSAAGEAADTTASVGSDVIDLTTRAASRVADVAGSVVDGAADAASTVTRRTADLAGGAAETVRDTAGSAAGGATGTAGEAAERARSAASAAADTVTGAASQAAGTATGVASRATDTATDVASRATDTATDVASRATDTATDVASRATDTATDVASRATDTASDAAARAADAAQAPRDAPVPAPPPVAAPSRPPFPGYDRLTGDSVMRHVASTDDVAELRQIQAYEQGRKARKGVLRAVEERLAELSAG